MSEKLDGRETHQFTFHAGLIARAAQAQADYHRQREQYWNAQYESADRALQGTMKIQRRIMHVTGGDRIDYFVDFGDGLLHSTMNEALGKRDSHRQYAERYEVDAALYRTQGDKSYILNVSDIHYFHLAGEKNED